MYLQLRVTDFSCLGIFISDTEDIGYDFEPKTTYTFKYAKSLILTGTKYACFSSIFFSETLKIALNFAPNLIVSRIFIQNKILLSN